jgi:diadenosine tetraphosphate (Ap4A) HIT family hydrolase
MTATVLPHRITLRCELCEQTGGEVIWQNADFRVVHVADAAFPAYYRVIAQQHVPEFSDLSRDQQTQCMDCIVCIENVLRKSLHPTKINLAALGNMVPHLHWHIIARFEWDTHFPQPIWGMTQRPALSNPTLHWPLTLQQLHARVGVALSSEGMLHPFVT